MTEHNLAKDTMRTVRFHQYGEPGDVLRMEETTLPSPGPNRIRVRVTACGLNPADWALCRGLFPANLPRGIGLDVSGAIDTVGEGVVDVGVGDQVLGVADYAGCATAGASDYAICCCEFELDMYGSLSVLCDISSNGVRQYGHICTQGCLELENGVGAQDHLNTLAFHICKLSFGQCIEVDTRVLYGACAVSEEV